MSTQVGRLGLLNVEHEMKLLLQKSRDTSKAGVPLRAVYESVAVSGNLYNVRQGLSADVSSSIPQSLINATSDFARAQILDNYSSKIHGRMVDSNGKYNILDKVQDFLHTLKSFSQPNAAPQPCPQNAVDALGDLTRECNESYKFLSELQNEVFEAIKVEVASLNASVTSLFSQYEIMKGSSHDNRACITGRYYDSLLELAESIGIDVPLSGIEDGDIPAKVSVNMPGYPLTDALKAKLSLGVVEKVDPAAYPQDQDAIQILLDKYDSSDSGTVKIDGILYGDFSSDPQGSPTNLTINDKSLLKVDTSNSKGSGKLGALLELYTKVIPKQQKLLYDAGAVLNANVQQGNVPANLIPALPIVSFDDRKTDCRIFDLTNGQPNLPQAPNLQILDAAKAEILKLFTDSLSEVSKIRNSFIEEKKHAESLLDRVQSERDASVKMTQQEFWARMWELDQQKELLLRLLEIMVSFYKDIIAKLGVTT